MMFLLALLAPFAGGPSQGPGQPRRRAL